MVSQRGSAFIIIGLTVFGTIGLFMIITMASEISDAIGPTLSEPLNILNRKDNKRVIIKKSDMQNLLDKKKIVLVKKVPIEPVQSNPQIEIPNNTVNTDNAVIIMASNEISPSLRFLEAILNAQIYIYSEVDTFIRFSKFLGKTFVNYIRTSMQNLLIEFHRQYPNDLWTLR
ncbi:hypothetical protein NEAUS06_1464 [Nematocida ausubeli]|nr:hypothetical protein NEAUS06_1464 [Nematocida ausubeli]